MNYEKGNRKTESRVERDQKLTDSKNGELRKANNTHIGCNRRFCLMRKNCTGLFLSSLIFILRKTSQHLIFYGSRRDHQFFGLPWPITQSLVFRER